MAPRALEEAPRRIADLARQRLPAVPMRLKLAPGGQPEAPEALGAAISRLQRLSRPKWLHLQFYRVFSSILEPGDLSGCFPNGSGKLEEASGGFKLAQEEFLVASRWLKRASERGKWLRIL